MFSRILLRIVFFFLVSGIVAIHSAQVGKATTQHLKSEEPEAPESAWITYDDYGLNIARYDSCYPQLEMTRDALRDNPDAICVIEGFREKRERQSTSRLRAELAKSFMVSYLGIPPERILTQDRGTEKTGKHIRGEFRRTNRRIVVRAYQVFNPKERRGIPLPFVFDDYRRNVIQYNTCIPYLDLALSELHQDTELHCLISGHREQSERKTASFKRANDAKGILAFKGIGEGRILTIDAGAADLLRLHHTGPFPKTFSGRPNRFIEIGLFYPLAIKGFQ